MSGKNLPNKDSSVLGSSFCSLLSESLSDSSSFGSVTSESLSDSSSFGNVLGFAKAESNQVVIAGLNPETTYTFYHELGHIFENYLNPRVEDYLNIRSGVNLDNTYEGSFYENFAEDFRYVMYPYTEEEKRGSFTKNPEPTKDEMEELKDYITNLQDNGGKQGSYVKINENIAISNV